MNPTTGSEAIRRPIVCPVSPRRVRKGAGEGIKNRLPDRSPTAVRRTGLDQKSPALTPSALLRRRAYVVMDIFSLIRRAKLGTTRTRRSIGGFRRIIDANPWSWEPFPGLFLGSIAASLT